MSDRVLNARFQVGTEFGSWAEFQEALEVYQQETHTRFVSRRSVPVKPTDRHQELVNRSADYWCVHHGVTSRKVVNVKV